MRILTICDVLFPQTIGGAGRVAREVAQALKRRGHELHFLTRKTSHLPPEGDIPVTYFPPIGRSLPPQYRKIYHRVVQAFKPDLIHVHQPLPASLMVPRTNVIPVVQSFHSSWAEELKIKASPFPAWSRYLASWLYASIERRSLQRASAVVVESEFMRAEVHRLYRRQARRIPGGVDTRHFKPCDTALGSSVVRLVTVRNLVPRMGLLELIEAMSHLPQHFRLDIGGEGPLRKQLQDRIRALRLTQRVVLRGHIPDEELPRFYSSADWFVLPTIAQEGFGLVILESLACGTPVLGTRIGAIPELLEPIDPSWVIPAPTSSAIAGTILHVSGKPVPDRAALRERIAREYDWQRIAEKYESLFQTLIPHA